MAFSKIYYMNIVAATSAIRCVVVITVNRKFFEFTFGNFYDIWHKIVRDTFGIFSDKARGMVANRIEITKGNSAEVFVGKG